MNVPVTAFVASYLQRLHGACCSMRSSPFLFIENKVRRRNRGTTIYIYIHIKAHAAGLPVLARTIRAVFGNNLSHSESHKQIMDLQALEGDGPDSSDPKLKETEGSRSENVSG